MAAWVNIRQDKWRTCAGHIWLLLAQQLGAKADPLKTENLIAIMMQQKDFRIAAKGEG